MCGDAGTENQCKAGNHCSKLGPTGLSFGICFAFRVSDKLVIDFSDRTKKNFGFHSIIPSFSRNRLNSFLIRKSKDVTLLSLIPYASAISRIA